MHLMIGWWPSSLGTEAPTIAALETRTIGHLMGVSGLVVVSGGGVSIGDGGPGRGRTVVVAAVVLGFCSGMACTKAMGFRSSVVRGGGVVFGRGATVGGIAWGLMVEICCPEILMELMFLDSSPMYVVMKVHVVAVVKYHGAGRRSVVLTGGTVLPLALDNSTLMVVSSSIEFITQV